MTEVTSGWYADPEDPTRQRFWDGERWTDERQPLPPTPPPPSPAGPTVKSAKSRGLGAVRRLADRAQASELGRAVVEAGHSGAQQLTATAKDPQQRAAFLATAYPMAEAAADGAGVRNKHGQVKTWRVARAAIRPRKSLAGATTAVAGEAGRKVLQVGADAADLKKAEERRSPTEAEVLAEWPRVDPVQDLADWREGITRFENALTNDHSEMRACAQLMGEGLKHALLNRSALGGFQERVTETVADVIIAALQGNDQTTWGPEDERHVRLALVVARREGIQPEDLGGNGELGILLDDHGSRMLMMAALSPTPWDFSLRSWFGVAATD